MSSKNVNDPTPNNTNTGKQNCNKWIFFNLGGLDSRDQSRSRLRLSFVSRLTFENREYPSCQDQLFFSWLRFLKLRFFGQDLSLSRYLFRDCRDKSRLSRFIETFEIYQEFSRFLDIIKTFSRLFRDFRLKNIDKLRNLDREMW